MLLRVQMVTLEMSANVVFLELTERRYEYNETYQAASRVVNAASPTLCVIVSFSREILVVLEDQVHLAQREWLDQR